MQFLRLATFVLILLHGSLTWAQRPEAPVAPGTVQFILASPGARSQAWYSDGNLIIFNGGVVHEYRRAKNLDSPDGRYRGYHNLASNQSLRFPVNGQGAMQKLTAAGWQFTEMQVLPVERTGGAAPAADSGVYLPPADPSSLPAGAPRLPAGVPSSSPAYAPAAQPRTAAPTPAQLAPPPLSVPSSSPAYAPAAQPRTAAPTPTQLAPPPLSVPSSSPAYAPAAQPRTAAPTPDGGNGPSVGRPPAGITGVWNAKTAAGSIKLFLLPESRYLFERFNQADNLIFSEQGRWQLDSGNPEGATLELRPSGPVEQAARPRRLLLRATADFSRITLEDRETHRTMTLSR